MPTLEVKIAELLTKTQAGPVFGPGVAFKAMSDADTQAMLDRIARIGTELQKQLEDCLKRGLPDLPAAAVAARARAIVAKASCFVAALAPELRDTKRLTQAALAIGLMYAADEGMDRGDRAMQLAVEQAYDNNAPKTPPPLKQKVANRMHLLDDMRTTILGFSRPEDGEFVFSCYSDAVLRNEAALQRLSEAYRQQTTTDQKNAFLANHATELATRMVEDAGVQSVTASLETQYPQAGKQPPSLPHLHKNPKIAKLIQIANAVARVADEWGDRTMDAGTNPEKGVFSINLFNQYHEEMVATVCRLAHLTAADTIAALQHATQIQDGAFVTETFFAHVRSYIDALPADFRKQHNRYIVLTMRVLEISHVNMQGDIALSGETNP